MVSVTQVPNNDAVMIRCRGCADGKGWYRIVADNGTSMTESFNLCENCVRDLHNQAAILLISASERHRNH